MNLGQDALQALVNQWGRDSSAARAESQLTLGGLIKALDAAPQDRPVVGFGAPHSYRGYYTDLSFEPTEATLTVSELLTVCRGAMGKVFQGYKGGDYLMGENTPLWLSNYGESGGMKVVGLNTEGAIIQPVLEEEDWS